MTDTFNAFEMSPVPEPVPGAVPPDVYRGIYGMPMFVTIPTPDLPASVDFWVRGFGFIDLFSVPGRLTHLRRWAFQDALLVPSPHTAAVPASSVSFACVLSEIDRIAEACTALRPGCTEGPRHMPWNSVEVEVITPENARVVFTAAKPLDADSDAARFLADMGIETPRGG